MVVQHDILTDLLDLYMSDFLQKENNNNYDKLNFLAIKILEYCGNDIPNEKQINVVENLLMNSSILKKGSIDNKLTRREKLCLHFAANGESISSTSLMLGVSSTSIELSRKSLRNKLRAKTMPHAVYIATNLGWIV